MNKYKAVNIKWDTSDEEIEMADAFNIPTMPEQVDLPAGMVEGYERADYISKMSAEDMVNNFLSNKYGWCVISYNIIKE